MGRFRFRLATLDDDKALRDLMAATPMDGHIALRFLREPSFFDAASIDGTFRQIAVCEDTAKSRIVGLGTRSLRTCYVQGEPMPVGYLSSLRSAPDVRRGPLLAGAYRFLRELHEDGRAPFYLSTIAEGNTHALRMLTSGRAGLPAYQPLGAFHTVAVPVPVRPVPIPPTPPGLEIRPAAEGDLPALLTFLQEAGKAQPFFPAYTREDFEGDSPTFRDLKLGDILLASRGGRLVGVLAGWDQHGFKQTIVERYSGPLSWLRPAYNAYAWARNKPGLPRPGAPFRYIMGALPVVADNDPAVFNALLQSLVARSSGRAGAYCLIGLHESHPLLPVARTMAAQVYRTRLYRVSWEESSVPLPARGEPPYLELGCL